MFRLALSLLAFCALLLALVAAQDNIEAGLTRARALYDQDQFEESLQLLMTLEDALRSQPERIDDQVEIKLQMALNLVALEKNAEARNRIAELYALDPYFSLDGRQFPSNLVLLFDEVRSETRSSCSKICRDGDVLLESADAGKLLELLKTHGSRCVCLAALAKDAAEYFFLRGKDAQQDGDLTDAMQEFDYARRLDPEHAAVDAAITGVRAEMEAAAEKAFAQWRADVAAGQFGLASVIFRQMLATKTANAPAILEQMRAGYRQHLAPAMQQWNEGCSRNDGLLMNRAREQAAEVLPDPQVGQELVTEWMVCDR